MRIEQFVEMGQQQHFADGLGNVTEFQVAMHLPCAGQGAHHGSQAAAVDEYHLAKMKNDRPTIAQQMSHVGAQSFDLAAGNDASLAAHDGDAAYFAGFH
jgi:hypothetical protein